MASQQVFQTLPSPQARKPTIGRWMEQITQCEGQRQVRSIVNAYNDEDFEDLVNCQEVFAK